MFCLEKDHQCGIVVRRSCFEAEILIATRPKDFNFVTELAFITIGVFDKSIFEH